MKAVIFDEESGMPQTMRSIGGITGWLVRKKIVTTPAQANLLMLFLTLICFAGALLLFHRTVTAEKIDPLKNFVPAYSAQRP